MVKYFSLVLLLAQAYAGLAQSPVSPASDELPSKTSFQIAEAWDSSYDVRSDIAMVYGVNDAGGHFEERVKGWRDKGYNVQFMTGIAWGQYKDYFTGEWDGRPHLDEGQVQRNGDTIWHGHLVPYIVPTANFLSYMKTHVKRAIDAGVTAIYLEEPEFWARSGYSAAFRNEWKDYYKEDWRPQHESPEATYMSSKLKYALYLRALQQMFSYAKSYAASVGKTVQCYVPTHSLINYSSWQIVSPEASLASIKEMDGYIAQVWTGTSREPVYYNGTMKERVFENAFLEYGSMVSMTAPTGKRMYFLTDPIEDRAKTWDDYKRNYQATFSAELLYPSVSHFEVMPWPQRIYNGKFKMEGSDERQPIPAEYATQMQVMVNALNEMPETYNKLNGSQGIGVLVSNSMMFQRFPTHAGYEDPQLSNFYGMALPLLKEGIPVETVHMENLENKNTLANISVLVMSYANMKPLSETYHKEIAAWVKKGGVLLYYGRDKDPFQSIHEWWNSDGKKYQSPSEDLFVKMAVDPTREGVFQQVEKGWVQIVREDPKELVLQKNGHLQYVAAIKTAYETNAGKGKLVQKNNFVLHRGPYIIAAALDENDRGKPLEIKGPVIDLFDPKLPLLSVKEVPAGTQAFLYDLSYENSKKAQILAAAARATDEKQMGRVYSFTVKSPSKTENVMRIRLPKAAREITAKKNGMAIPIDTSEWDAATRTLLLGFQNYSEGVEVRIRW